jgi:hypothetical protein
VILTSKADPQSEGMAKFGRKGDDEKTKGLNTLKNKRDGLFAMFDKVL